MNAGQWRSRLDNLRGRPYEDGDVDSELAALASELRGAIGEQPNMAEEAGATRKVELILNAMVLANDDATRQNLPVGAEMFAARIVGPLLATDISEWVAEQMVQVNAVADERKVLEEKLSFAELHHDVLKIYSELLDQLIPVDVEESLG